MSRDRLMTLRHGENLACSGRKMPCRSQREAACVRLLKSVPGVAAFSSSLTMLSPFSDRSKKPGNAAESAIQAIDRIPVLDVADRLALD